jgi:hypothetical protein
MGVQPPPDFAPCPSPTTACAILPLGDSITDRVGSSGGGYRVELFRRALANQQNITFVGTAANGPNVVNVHASIETVIEFLTQQIDDLDGDIEKLMRSTPLWREAKDLLRSVPGVRAVPLHGNVDGSPSQPCAEGLLRPAHRARQTRMVAIMATMRKLLTVLNAMARSRRPWTPQLTG